MKALATLFFLGFTVTVVHSDDQFGELIDNSVKPLDAAMPRVLRAEPVRPIQKGSPTGVASTPAPGAVKAVATPAPSTPVHRSDGRHVVALDIGHTSSQPGCYSASGRGEYFFNKDIVESIYAQLKDSPRIAPFIINPDGKSISLPMRTALASRHGAELFIAIHHDSAQDKYLTAWEVNGKRQFYSDDFQGYGVFISQKNPQATRSLGFGRLLGRQMAEAGFEFSQHHNEPVKGENRPIIDKDNGVYRYDDLIVLKTAPMPAVLLECGVIVNREQEKILRDTATQEKIASAVIAAIDHFFKSQDGVSR